MKLRSDPKEITRALGLLFRADDVVEMRVPKTEREGTVSGYFTDHGELAKQLAARNGDAGVYVALNPTVPSLLARCANRVKARAGTTTSDKDIAKRRWLLVDCDPVRPAEISSSDIEHEAALERARDIRLVLSEEGWPAPLLADSGNGAHLLYAVDLPNDDAATALVKAVLTALAIRFDDGVVKIDQAVFNAARIVKCYGTVAGKGDDIPDRPHRLSRIIDAPVHVEPVRRELLEEMVQRAKVEATAPQPLAAHENSDSRSRFDIDAFIAKHLSAREPVAHEGGRKWVLEECPFNPEHKAPDAAIFQRANDGPLAFKCFHNSCAGMTWKDVREKFEPRPNRQEKKQGAARSASPRLQPPKLLNYGELKGIETPMQRPLFDGYPLPARGATLLFGQSKAGKTILALQVALAIARGKPLFDYYSLSQKGAGGVLVVEQDDPDGAAGIRDLVERSGGGPLDMPFYLVPRVPFSFGPAFLDWLEKEITSRKLVMVVLDSYTALRGSRPPGMDIVKAENYELAALDELGKRLECSIVIIHHDSTGKAGRSMEWTLGAAGTFAMSQATEAQIHIARFIDMDIKAPERLVRARPRHGADVHLVLRFREKTEDYEHVLENSAAAWYPAMREIKSEFGKEPFGIKSLSQATGASRTTAFRLIDRLRCAGAIQKTGYGEYVLVASL